MTQVAITRGKQNVALVLAFTGMVILLGGLVLAFCHDVLGVDLLQGKIPPFGKMSPAFVGANTLWTIGAIILIVPPCIEGFYLLVVLEIFLTISGVLSFWQPEIYWLKLLVRLALSGAALYYLKRSGLVSDFEFPRSLFKASFYFQALKANDSHALVIGLELLGLGYAFNNMLLLTVGSLFLARSNWLTFVKTQKSMLLAWFGLNVSYTIVGLLDTLARVFAKVSS